MELNLIASNCTLVRIVSECELNQSISTKIKECAALPPEGAKEGIQFSHEYKADNVKHAVIGFLFEGDKPNLYIIAIHYKKRRLLKKEKKETKPISILLDCLKELPSDLTFSCTLRFEYPSSKFSSILPLPMKLGGDLFDEIRGFRLVKHKKKQISYDAIIDRPSNRKIYHNISFDHAGKFNIELPKSIFDKGNEISKKFVKRK